MTSFDIDRGSYKQLEVLINDIQKSFLGQYGDTKALLETVASDAIIPVIAARFNRGGLQSRSWQPLSPHTIRHYDTGAPPLTDSGEMSAQAISMDRFKITEDSLLYGSNFSVNRWWAPIHDFGGESGWGSYIPARPWAIADQEMLTEIDRVLEDWIESAIDNFMSSRSPIKVRDPYRYTTLAGYTRFIGISKGKYTGYSAYKAVRTTAKGRRGQDVRIARDVLVPVRPNVF